MRNQHLYQVAIKAGLYRKALQVCIYLTLLHIPLPFSDSSPNLNVSNHSVAGHQAHRTGYLGLVPDETGEKFVSPFAPTEDQIRDPPHAKPTLYHVTIKAGLFRKAVQVPQSSTSVHIPTRRQHASSQLNLQKIALVHLFYSLCSFRTHRIDRSPINFIGTIFLFEG